MSLDQPCLKSRAVLGAHIRPPLFYTPLPTSPTTMPVKSTKQDFAKDEKPKRLDKRDRFPAKDGGDEPIPEPLHDVAKQNDAQRDHGRDPQSLQQPILPHGFTSMTRSILFPDFFQPFAQVQNGITFPREECVEARSRFRRQLLEAATLKLVRDEDFALSFG